MADIVNTPRGPIFKATGTIRAKYYVIPVRRPWTVTLANLWTTPGYEREYYEWRPDGEWHWSHTEPRGYKRYPDPPPPPEYPLPDGV